MDKFGDIFTERNGAVRFVNEIEFKAEHTLVIAVHIRARRQVERLAAAADKAEFIHLKPVVFIKQAIAESEETIVGIPAHERHLLTSLRDRIKIFFHLVKAFSLSDEHKIAEVLDAFLEAWERHHFLL